MRRYRALPYLIIVLLGFAVYFNSLKGQFVYDDAEIIAANPFLNKPLVWTKIFDPNVTNERGIKSYFFRPFLDATYALDHWAWKENAWGYHLSNILLHLLAALALYVLVHQLVPEEPVAFLTSLLFVVHPLHTEAVAYISGRAEPLAALLVFLSFIFYLKIDSTKSSKRYFLLLAFCFIAAILSKEYSLILPALILIYHDAFKKKLAIKPFGLIAMIGGVYLLLRFGEFQKLLTHHPHPSHALERLPGFFVAMTQYFRLLFLPFNLHMEYGLKLFQLTDPQALIGLFVFSTCLGLAFWNRRRRPWVYFSMLWFFIGLLPISNIFPINAYMAEHWLYLPSIGFFMAIAHFWNQALRTRFKVMATILFCFLIGFYSYLTIGQNRTWRDAVAFYERTLRYEPNTARIYNNLGAEYKNRGQRLQAIANFKKAIEVDPNTSEAYYNLGYLYATNLELEEAIECYRKTISLNPKHSLAYNNLAAIYEATGKNEEALEFYRKSLELNPHYTLAYKNMTGLQKKLAHRT